MVDGSLRVDCPTDEFKQAIRRVVLTFEATPQAISGCEGLIALHAEGKRLELVIYGYGDAHMELFESLKPAPVDVEVVELNLEDAFIEYTRGSRRAMPVFAGERE
jgi:ABC-2 type transport system ATP-binding protein